MDKVYKSIAQEAAYKRLIQVNKYSYTYTLSGIIPANTTAPLILAIEQDADFCIEKITGSVYGPVALVTGIPSGGATDFDMPGTSTGFACRGLTVKITDTGAGRELTNGFVPVENILTPGYGDQFYQPYRLNYMVKRSSKLRFDFRNRDTRVGAHQQVDVCLNGYKYGTNESDVMSLMNEMK